MPSSNANIDIFTKVGTSVDFNALLTGVVAGGFSYTSFADDTVTFTDAEGRQILMLGLTIGKGFAVDEYVLLDPKGQGVFDISLLGSHFVLINQTPTTFETLMKQQIGDIASGNDINMTFMGEAGAETVKGTAFRDFLSGGGGNDHLYGGAGADDLLGGVGADVLIGGRGKDNLNGQSGVDQLTGGSGADHFNFTGMVTRASGDTITDFQSSQGDKIDLSRLDAIDGTVGLDHFAFIQTGAFDGNKGELRYEAETGGVVVQGDTNGDGTADFTLHLQNVTTLQATDFILA